MTAEQILRGRGGEGALCACGSGAVIGKDRAHGVINARHEVFGYRNMLVCDGAAVPANPGVNPSLTTTVMAEAAIAEVPVKAA